MAPKKSYGSSAQEGRTKKNARSTLIEYDRGSLLKYFLGKDLNARVSDSKIDYSDIPELTKRQMKQAKRAKVGRPSLGVLPRKMISIKIDPFLLEEIRKQAKNVGKKYQSFVHEILERFVMKKPI